MQKKLNKESKELKSISDFNRNLKKWKVDKVTTMMGMFRRCERYQGKGLEFWNTENEVKKISTLDSAKMIYESCVDDDKKIIDID